MSIRPELGDFMSIVCMKAMMVGVEDTLGMEGAGVVFTRAGKIRGQDLVKSMGLAGSNLPLDQVVSALDKAIGREGTRLAKVVGARMEEGNTVVITVTEIACLADEAPGSSRISTFTLGALWGALETVTGNSYIGKNVSTDTFVFSPL